MIPDSVTSIGGSAFYECTSLTSITIPQSVTSIGDGAFFLCTSLTSIIYSGSIAPSLGTEVFEVINSEATFTAPTGATGYGATFGGVKVKDTTAPVIALVSDANVTIYSGTSYTDAGATASDNVDGNITSSISVTNPVDSNTVGTYTVTYSVSDSAGTVSYTHLTLPTKA